ncbi:MAG: anthranilate phosphoribosyltransferase [Nitrospinota bacterium]
MSTIPELLARIARGQKGSRPLNREEARWLFDQLLQPDVDRLQLGATLIALRVKEESEDEVAGFIEAARGHVTGYGKTSAPSGAVDLPCYAGKRNSTPAHLIAALRARDEGIPIFVHGLTEIAGRVTAWPPLESAGVRKAGSLDEAAKTLAGEGIVWMDIADICPSVHGLLKLRAKLGVRSVASTIARMINPLVCDGQLSGASHNPFICRMCRINAIVGQKRSFVFRGTEGEPELDPKAGRNLAIQDGDSISRVDCGLEAGGVRARSKIDTGLIIERFKAMRAGDMDEEEQWLVERMKESFAYASTGKIPDGWKSEPFTNEK